MVKSNLIQKSRDDVCQGVHVASEDVEITGLKDAAETKKLVKKAKAAILAAANRKGGDNCVKLPNINRCVEIGDPAVNLPGMQCEDFMSPKDCNLLFNVCDPVICPSSRCNYGGQYPVSDVIQSGIIGSALLCLPNAGSPSDGKVVVPVCLSGLHAGAEGWISVMENHRDCLQKNLETGEQVGICDEIYSIYACDFFVRQAIPLANLGVPKLIQGFLDNNKGGGEYFNVKESWENAGKSVDYFTQYYGANSFKAFQIRSTSEVGGALCKVYASANYPTSGNFLDALLEPDVPVQFHAWFHEIPYTTSTVPPTSQYKVFYHIYAGKDAGAYYNVYLRRPDTSSFYNTAQSINVKDGSGYIAKGDYASQTIDFTAPTGYQELCVNVNGQEDCGFKQVSTSFAVDFVADEYIKDQVENKEIESEKECIEGSKSLYGLISPNIQGGAEEALNPELYNRGIIRVCATDNPGKGTDGVKADSSESRWVPAGYCDEEKNVKCWLDRENVKDTVIFDSSAEEALSGFTEEYLRIRSEGDYLTKTSSLL